MAKRGRKPQTHCKHGHPFTKENTYIRKGGGRDCIICRKERQARFRRENPNYHKEYGRKWRAENPDYMKEWYAKRAAEITRPLFSTESVRLFISNTLTHLGNFFCNLAGKVG